MWLIVSKLYVFLIGLQSLFLQSFSCNGSAFSEKEVKWSILICTIDEREELFSKLYSKLISQISKNHLEGKVEILFFKDNRELSIGYKRNQLLQASHGEYVCFIDDDDDISDDYIQILYEKISHNPDTVSLCGILLQEGLPPRRFYHSIAYQEYTSLGRRCFRPPNHLNVIRASIAKQFFFADISYGEDTDWAMRICKSGLLKKEEQVNSPYYFYRYRKKNG